MTITQWLDNNPKSWALIPIGFTAFVAIIAFSGAIIYGGSSVVYEDADTTCTSEDGKVTCRDRATGEVQCTYTVVQGRGGVAYHGCQ